MAHLLLVPLFGLLLTSNAFADAIVNTDSGLTPANILTGINGLVNVSEQPCGSRNMVPCNNSPASGVQYSLNILDPHSTLAISAFAVSTNTMASPNNVATSRSGWSGLQFLPEDWNLQLGSVGLFSTLFGSDLYVNYFSSENSNPVTVGFDGVFEFFQFQGRARSNFVALNANNGIIDQSRRANTVPEPAPLALLGFGLLGIGLMRRRRRS